MKILFVCTANKLRILAALLVAPSSLRYLALSPALIWAFPSILFAEGDYIGRWRPYSDPDLWYGPMTIRHDHILYETGPRAGLARARGRESIFRLVDPRGVVFEDCGNEPARYIGFHVLGNGTLAVLHYRGDTPPPEPAGNDALQVIDNLIATNSDTCSVAFFIR